MNQRIRFKGPRRDWHPLHGGTSAVSVAPEHLETRPGNAAEIAATAAADAFALRADEASWQTSSYDLMSGLQITEFEDTVPDALLDDLGL